MGGRWRAVAMSLVLVGASALPSAGQSPSTDLGGSSPTPVASPVASAAASPETRTPIPEWVPADIAIEIDAIRSATTLEDAEAATRVVLERAGVVIADDPATAALTPAALSVGFEDLEAMALEAMAGPGTARTSYDRFAVTFGGAAGLAGDDAFRDRLDGLDLTAGPDASPGVTAADTTPTTGTDPATPSGPGDQLDLSGLPDRMAGFLNAWLAIALEHHAAPEPELVALTNAPLYVAALASVRPEALDLRAPFSPGDLRLGMLEVTLLTAGMRAPLAYAQAGILDVATAPRVHLASWRMPRATTPSVPDQSFSDCDQLKRLIDSRVPISIVVGLQGKDFIKSMVQRFVENLFGAATAWSGPRSRRWG